MRVEFGKTGHTAHQHAARLRGKLGGMGTFGAELAAEPETDPPFTTNGDCGRMHLSLSAAAACANARRAERMAAAHTTLTAAERKEQDALRKDWAEHGVGEPPTDPIFTTNGDCGRMHMSLSAA